MGQKNLMYWNVKGGAGKKAYQNTGIEKPQIEKEIQEKGLNAPRLNPEKIDSVIVSKTFTVLPWLKKGKTVIQDLRNSMFVILSREEPPALNEAYKEALQEVSEGIVDALG